MEMYIACIRDDVIRRGGEVMRKKILVNKQIAS